MSLIVTKDIRNAFIARLQEEFTEAEAKVESFPINPKNYLFTHPKMTVLVRVADKSFGRPEMSGECSVNIRFELTICFRGTQTQDEIDDGRDRILMSLTGFYPNEQYERPYCVSDNILEYALDHFIFKQTYEINTLYFLGY